MGFKEILCSLDLLENNLHQVDFSFHKLHFLRIIAQFIIYILKI